MAVNALTPDQIVASVGDVWVLRVLVRNVDCVRVDQQPVFTVTDPDGIPATPAPQRMGVGDYRAVYTLAVAGRHVAEAVVVDLGTALFAAYAAGPTTDAGMPQVNDVAKYLREFVASWDTDDLQDTLDAEAAAQRAVCRVGAVFPADLREALLRRVQRNLAMRAQPLAVLIGDAEAGSTTVLPGRDPEVRRLEAPHRRLVVG